MIALLLAALAFGGDLPGRVTESSPHYELEELYRDGAFDDGIAKAKTLIAANPDDADLYWIAVRFMFEQGELMGDRTSSEKMAHYTEMGGHREPGPQAAPRGSSHSFRTRIGQRAAGNHQGCALEPLPGPLRRGRLARRRQ